METVSKRTIKKRRISIGKQTYYYSVSDEGLHTKLRCYGEVKSSFVEVYLPYGRVTWLLNVYGPKIAAKVIAKALQRGWEPELPNQVLTIPQSDPMLLELLREEFEEQVAIRPIDHQQEKTAERILQIQQRAYQIEAELIGFTDIPALKDTVAIIQSSQETFIGFMQGEQEILYGFLSFEESKENVLTICRLVVWPVTFRLGIGTKLLETILQDHPGKRLEVHTGSKNIPALNLYRKHNFVEIEQIEVAPDIFLSKLIYDGHL